MRLFYLVLFLTIAHFSYSQATNSDCIESYVLSNTESNGNYTYNAQNSITTENNYKILPSNNEIRMKAGSVIVLKPDSYIKRGSVYLARIEPCTPCPLGFSYYNFFTPNADGINDYWKVNWDNPYAFSPVSIFDRYGKLLKVLKNPNDSWNGQYNANTIFSTDYWFELSYVDCNGNQKEFKSHFSLKR